MHVKLTLEFAEGLLIKLIKEVLNKETQFLEIKSLGSNCYDEKVPLITVWYDEEGINPKLRMEFSYYIDNGKPIYTLFIKSFIKELLDTYSYKEDNRENKQLVYSDMLNEIIYHYKNGLYNN